MNTSWRDVLRECLALAKLLSTERIERAATLGRVLTEDLRADCDYPSADLSMMDGYAIGTETVESYSVDGENTPGAGAGAPLAAGITRPHFYRCGVALQGNTRFYRRNSSAAKARPSSSRNGPTQISSVRAAAKRAEEILF